MRVRPCQQKRLQSFCFVFAQVLAGSQQKTKVYVCVCGVANAPNIAHNCSRALLHGSARRRSNWPGTHAVQAINDGRSLPKKGHALTRVDARWTQGNRHDMRASSEYPAEFVRLLASLMNLDLKSLAWPPSFNPTSVQIRPPAQPALLRMLGVATPVRAPLPQPQADEDAGSASAPVLKSRGAPEAEEGQEESSESEIEMICVRFCRKRRKLKSGDGQCIRLQKGDRSNAA